MKKFILSILLFFAIVVIIDIFVGFVGDYMQAHAKGGETRKTNDLVMKEEHDVLVFGSSRACHHYDTPYLSEALGVDVYNAGYDGNGIVLAYGLLKMILERYKPQLIIYDVEPSFDINVYAADNNHKRYIGKLKPYYRNQAAGEVIKDVSMEEWYKVHSGMMRYNTFLINMAYDYALGSMDESRGYSPLNGIYTGELRTNEGTIKIDSFKLGYVEKFLLLAKNNSIPVLVVASPKYYQGLSASLETVKDICKRLDVPFLDYYANPKFISHKEWFKEPMHLNEKGVKVFSEAIASDIKPFLDKLN